MQVASLQPLSSFLVSSVGAKQNASGFIWIHLKQTRTLKHVAYVWILVSIKLFVVLLCKKSYRIKPAPGHFNACDKLAQAKHGRNVLKTKGRPRAFCRIAET